MNKPTAVQILTQAALSATSFLVPVLAVSLGADLLEVGVIGATFGAAQFLASAVGGRLADIHGRRRLLKLGLAASAAASLLHLVAWDPATLAVARGLFGLAAGLFPPALLSIAYDRNRKLGRFTGWGSAGFAAGAVLGGLAVLRVSEDVVQVFYLSSALLAAAFAVALAIRAPPEHSVVVHLFPGRVIRRNAPAYVAMLLRHAGAASVWLVFPLYLVEIGVPLAWVGFIHAANGVAQFLLMPRMDSFRPVPLVMWGLALTSATFLGFIAAENRWHFLLLQPLLAASWACLYMGALKYVLEDRSEERATATGLLQSSIQLSNVLGPALGGAIAWRAGFRATFAVAAATSLLAILVFALEVRLRRAALEVSPS